MQTHTLKSQFPYIPARAPISIDPTTPPSTRHHVALSACCEQTHPRTTAALDCPFPALQCIMTDPDSRPSPPAPPTIPSTTCLRLPPNRCSNPKLYSPTSLLLHPRASPRPLSPRYTPQPTPLSPVFSPRSSPTPLSLARCLHCARYSLVRQTPALTRLVCLLGPHRTTPSQRRGAPHLTLRGGLKCPTARAPRLPSNCLHCLPAQL